MPRKSRTAPKTSQDEETWEMEDIVDYRVQDGVERWKVRWKGFSPADDTWEPQDHIIQPAANIKKKMVETKAAYEKKKTGGPATPKSASKKSADHHVKASPRVRAPSAERVASPTSSPTRGRNAKRALEVKRSPASKKKGPRGKPRVAHIGRSKSGGAAHDADHYEVTLVYGNGEREMDIVKNVRQSYPNELLEYLLSRVRFRESQ